MWIIQTNIHSYKKYSYYISLTIASPPTHTHNKFNNQSAKPITGIKIPVANSVTQPTLTNHRLIIIIIIIVVVEDNETRIPIMISIAVVNPEMPTQDVTNPMISNNPATVMEGAGDIRAEGRGFITLIPMIVNLMMVGMTTMAIVVTDERKGETKIENAVTTTTTVTMTAITPTPPRIRVGSHDNNNKNRRNQGDSKRRGHRTLNHRVHRMSLMHGRDSFMMR